MTEKKVYEGMLTVVIDDVEYEGEVFAKGTYFYQPCVMYFRDGTGQLEDEDFNVDDFQVETLFNNETGENVLEKYKNDTAFKEKVDTAMQDALNELEGGEWK